MTGFGKTTGEFNNRKYSIEIKSLNSKQTDITVRLPMAFREKEIFLRNILATELIRGKIEFSIRLDNDTSEKGNSINAELFNEYLNQLKALSEKSGMVVDSDTYFRTIMRMPDILKPVNEDFDEDEWSGVFQEIKNALNLMNDFRIQEGNAVGDDILQRIETIKQLSDAIEKYENERIENLRERIAKNLAEVSKKENIDQNRLEQEIIYYLEKLDITEEKVRLANHLSYFKQTADEEENVGKKLGFISQEIGREINTIGSKASHAEIQKIVVQMKDELEKIKEQLMNVL
jgi:uncharacterized protein (TIGR00255 family)